MLRETLVVAEEVGNPEEKREPGWTADRVLTPVVTKTSDW